MHHIGRLICAATALAALTGCNAVSSIVHDDTVVARVGKHKLYGQELASHIPEELTGMDSTNLAIQYINSWASEMLFQDVAESQLSREDKDVTDELEAYRRSLLRFRYEQLYVSDRLDTIITEAQKIAFYQAHKDLFELERPVLKVRYLQIAKNHPKRAYLVKKMASNKSSDLMEVDSLAFQCAVKYFDSSDEWLDAAQLASEFGLDVKKMMALYTKPYITSDVASDPDLKVAYVVNVQTKGTAPVEFCDEKIRNYILSGRKRELLVGLERDLLNQALDKGKYEIY